LDRDGALARIIKHNVPEPRNKFEALENIITFKQFKAFQTEAKAEAV